MDGPESAAVDCLSEALRDVSPARSIFRAVADPPEELSAGPMAHLLPGIGRLGQARASLELAVLYSGGGPDDLVDPDDAIQTALTSVNRAEILVMGGFKGNDVVLLEDATEELRTARSALLERIAHLVGQL